MLRNKGARTIHRAENQEGLPRGNAARFIRISRGHGEKRL